MATLQRNFITTPCQRLYNANQRQFRNAFANVRNWNPTRRCKQKNAPLEKNC